MPNSSRFTSRALATGSERLTGSLLLGATVAVATVAYAPGVSDRLFAQGVSCPSRMWLGVLCPFCGMTHAVVALLRGDVLGSLSHNALALFFLLGLLGSLVALFGRWRPRIPWGLSKSFVSLLIGLAFAGYSVGRNLV
jgi:hypothetical protein